MNQEKNQTSLLVVATEPKEEEEEEEEWMTLNGKPLSEMRVPAKTGQRFDQGLAPGVSLSLSDYTNAEELDGRRKRHVFQNKAGLVLAHLFGNDVTMLLGMHMSIEPMKL